MTITKIKILALDNAVLPDYATIDSAGMDLHASILESIILKPFDAQLIPTGISIALPKGFEGQVRPRSGLALKHKVTVLNAPGTIDADYRGEIKVLLINYSNQDFVIERHTRIAQLVISRYERILWESVDSLEDTARGVNGFGSTGA